MQFSHDCQPQALDVCLPALGDLLSEVWHHVGTEPAPSLGTRVMLIFVQNLDVMEGSILGQGESQSGRGGPFHTSSQTFLHVSANLLHESEHLQVPGYAGGAKDLACQVFFPAWVRFPSCCLCCVFRRALSTQGRHRLGIWPAASIARSLTQVHMLISVPSDAS